MPNFQRLYSVRVGETVPEQFELDLQVERESITRLNDGIATCVAVGDNGSRASCWPTSSSTRKSTPTGSRRSSRPSARSASRTTSPNSCTSSRASASPPTRHPPDIATVRCATLDRDGTSEWRRRRGRISRPRPPAFGRAAPGSGPRALRRKASWSSSRFSATTSWGVMWVTPDSGSTWCGRPAASSAGRQLQRVRGHHVVVGQPVHEQQRPLERGGRRRAATTGRRRSASLVRIAEVALGVVRVVQPPLGHRRAGDRGVEHVGPAQHGQRGEVAAEAPAADRHPATGRAGDPPRPRASRPSTWSSSTGPAQVEVHGPLPRRPRPGVPRPSITTTAKPWSANHCDVRNWARAACTRCAWGPPYGSSRTGSRASAGAFVREQHRRRQAPRTAARRSVTLGCTSGGLGVRVDLGVRPSTHVRDAVVVEPDDRTTSCRRRPPRRARRRHGRQRARGPPCRDQRQTWTLGRRRRARWRRTRRRRRRRPPRPRTWRSAGVTAVAVHDEAPGAVAVGRHHQPAVVEHGPACRARARPRSRRRRGTRHRGARRCAGRPRSTCSRALVARLHA